MLFSEIKIEDPAGFSYIMRSAVPGDAEAVAEFVRIMVTETDFLPWADVKGMQDPEYVKGFIEEFNADPRRTFVTDWKGSDLIAICELNNFGNDQSVRHRCIIVPGVRKAYWGTGVGMTLFRTLMKTSQALGYEQVEANVDCRNYRSYGLLHKLGYIDYGIGPRHDKDGDGTYHDVYRLIKWYDPDFDERERIRLGGCVHMDAPDSSEENSGRGE